MKIQSWMIKSWATIEWYLPPAAEEVPILLHAGTHVRDDDNATGLRNGDTVWILKDSPVPAGLAWEWVEVRPGIIMLADPNVMITNLKLVDANQQTLGFMEHLRVCNRVVHALPWQEQVRARLHETPQAAAMQPVEASMAAEALAARHAVFNPAPYSAAQTVHNSRLPQPGAHALERPRNMLTRASDLDPQRFLSPLRKAA